MPMITANKEEYEEMLTDLTVLETMISDVGTRLYMKFGAPRCGPLMIGLTAVLEAQDVLQHRMDREFSAEGIILANERAEAKIFAAEVIARKKAAMTEKRKNRNEIKKQIEDVAAQESDSEVAAVLNDKLNRKRKPSLFDLLPNSGRS